MSSLICAELTAQGPRVKSILGRIYPNRDKTAAAMFSYATTQWALSQHPWQAIKDLKKKGTSQ